MRLTRRQTFPTFPRSALGTSICLATWHSSNAGKRDRPGPRASDKRSYVLLLVNDGLPSLSHISYHREPPRFLCASQMTVSAWQRISQVPECTSRLQNTVACLLVHPVNLHLRPIRVVNERASHAMVLQMTKRTVAS